MTIQWQQDLVFRSLPAFSTTSRLNDRDQLSRREAPMIDNDVAVASPDEVQQKSILESTIQVPVKVRWALVRGSLLMTLPNCCKYYVLPVSDLAIES